MKTSFFFLSFVLLTFNQIAQILSSPSAENYSFFGAALKKARGLAEDPLSRDELENFAILVSTAYRCISKPKEVICYANKTELEECMQPIQKLFDITLSTKYEGLASMVVNFIISARDYICNAKFMEILDILNPCLDLSSKTLMKCWKDTLKIFENPEEIGNLKESYCKAFQDNEDCTLEVVTSNCENFQTRKSFSDMYKAFFINPCYL